MKTAVLYLRAPADLKDQQSVLVPQAVALGRYCEEHTIDVLEVFYDIKEDKSMIRPERTKLVHAIFDRKLKPDLLLFTTLEVFGDDLSDVLNLNHILAKYGVVTKAILQPNLVFASLPKSQIPGV